MASISTSNISHPKNILLNIQNLCLDFSLDMHGHYTFRDMFVRSLVNPASLIFRRRFSVLKNINLQLCQGDRLGLIGMNGCGKTTLCRVIAGMYVPKSGIVQINGHVRAIFDTDIGITPELTGRENVEILTELIFPEAENKRELANEAIAFAELGEFIDIPFYKYSKGMKTRLSLSLISSCPSDILILDEVYGGADAFFCRKVSKRVKRMIEDSGSVIFVTHLADELLTVCNRVLVIDQGEVLFNGLPSDGVKFYMEHLAIKASGQEN